MKLEGNVLNLGCMDEPTTQVVEAVRQHLPSLELRPLRIEVPFFNDQRALDMGSRFNICFEEKDVPAAYLAPEGVMRALERYVDFRDLGHRTPERPEDLVPAERATAPSPGVGGVRKGMTRAEVEAIHGEPLREDESQEGVITVQVASYGDGQIRFEVTYVEGVVVRVTPLEPR